MRPTVDLDLPLVLSPGDARPLSTQLATALRDAVHSGLLRPGDRLPPSRTLAQRLSVSRGTVTAAFDQLDGEGYLSSTQGAGTFVNTEIHALSAEPPLAPTTKPGPSTSEPPMDLTPGQPDTRRLADSAWRAAWKAATDTPPPHTDIPAMGLPELRSAIAEHLRIARGLRLDQASLMVTGGTGEGLALLVQTLSNQNSRPLTAAFEEPGYPTARRILTQLGVQIISVPVDRDGMVVEALPRGNAAPDLVYTTPSHQYPLGGRLPVSRRLALLQWAIENKSVIVEDDYDSEFRHTGAPLPAMASLDSELASVVHLGTFSKVLTPWLRTGYLAASPQMMFRLKAVRDALGNPVPGGTQLALAHYLESGALRRHIARSRRDYRHRRELLIRMLADSKQIQARALDGGLHVVLELPHGTQVDRLLGAAKRRGLLVANLAHYYADPAGPPRPGVVLGYGAASDLELRDAIGLLIELAG